MIRFARLFAAIDQTTSTNRKVEHLADYFATTPPRDAAWAVFFLTGRRLKRLVPSAAIRQWTLSATGLDAWLLDECYAVVGDGAETAALVFDLVSEAIGDRPQPDAPGSSLASWLEDRILPLRHLSPAEQQSRVLSWLTPLDRGQRLVLFKLLTGELRLGVSHSLVVRAVAQAAQLPATTIAARLMGEWTPGAAWYQSLLAPGVTEADLSRPYPFCLASPLDAGTPVETLGEVAAWQAEWKWDGIRAQLVKRAGRVHLWSRGEELITPRFPEVIDAAAALPDGVVLDGELLAFQDDHPLPFSALQQRIGRITQVARKARDVPVVFMAYDVLEEGDDVRGEVLGRRRQRLERLIAQAAAAWRTAPSGGSSSGLTRRAVEAAPLLPFDDHPAAGAGNAIRLSPVLPLAGWQDVDRLRRESRAHHVEGLMLKRRDSPYGVGRKRGDWWKAKVDPYTVDAVLIYAQPGSGKRASLLTDYTFGVWDGGVIVPVAKAYSGLTNEEIAEMDRWIRRHTVERFGPVRHVEPVHVFELGFEAIARSDRHRSGLALRFPRMLRWRRDKTAGEADSLETLKRMVESGATGAGGARGA